MLAWVPVKFIGKGSGSGKQVSCRRFVSQSPYMPATLPLGKYLYPLALIENCLDVIVTGFACLF